MKPLPLPTTLVRNETEEARAPQVPHLALKTGEGLIAIPPGATIYLIMDASRPDQIIPLILTKVRREFLEFVAVSSNPKNNRSVRFKATWQGKFVSGLAGVEPGKT